MEISVGKSTDGGWVSSGSGSTESDRFDLYTVSAVADNACYFAFDAHTQLENLVDVSQIAGGFGIYCLPFDSTPEGEDSSFPLLTEELATVYPLMAAALNANLPRDIAVYDCRAVAAPRP